MAFTIIIKYNTNTYNIKMSIKIFHENSKAWLYSWMTFIYMCLYTICLYNSFIFYRLIHLITHVKHFFIVSNLSYQIL